MADAPAKGIMLAERPAAQNVSSKAFLPASATEKLEPLGLTPAKKVHAAHAEPKPASITTQYRQWLASMGDAQRSNRDAHEEHEAREQQRKEAITAFSEKLRTTILNGGKVSEFWKAAGPAGSTTASVQQPATTDEPPATTAAPDMARLATTAAAEDMVEFVDQVYSEATAALTTATQPAASASTVPSAAPEPSPSAQAGPKKQESRPATSSSARGKKASSKPAWALSEEEVTAKEADEELELLQFADDLDFDSFVEKLDDVELQDTFKAMQEAEKAQPGGGDEDAAWRKSFVRALNHVAFAQMRKQQGQQDTDAVSVAGRSEGGASRASMTSRARAEATAAKIAAVSGNAREDADDKWDSSSRVGPADTRSQTAATKLQAAEEFLLENPDLKNVHSNASVRAMLVKSEQQLLQAAS